MLFGVQFQFLAGMIIVGPFFVPAERFSYLSGAVTVSLYDVMFTLLGSFEMC